MTPDELSALETRLSKFRDAERDCTRYDKLARTLAAIKERSPDCDVTHIVIDVVNKEVRYMTPERGRMTIGCQICSIKKDEHEGIVDEFISWAISEINRKLDDAIEQKRMA